MRRVDSQTLLEPERAIERMERTSSFLRKKVLDETITMNHYPSNTINGFIGGRNE